MKSRYVAAALPSVIVALVIGATCIAQILLPKDNAVAAETKSAYTLVAETPNCKIYRVHVGDGFAYVTESKSPSLNNYSCAVTR